MKKILFLTMALFFQSIYAQVEMSGNKLIKNGQSYKTSKYNDVFKNPEAISYFKKARTNNTFGVIFAIAGGGLIGASIPMLLTKKEKTHLGNTPYGPYYVETKGSYGIGYLLTGVVLVGVGIPFALAAKKNAGKAIKIENSDATAFQPYFKLESAGSGLALSFNF